MRENVITRVALSEKILKKWMDNATCVACAAVLSGDTKKSQVERRVLKLLEKTSACTMDNGKLEVSVDIDNKSRIAIMAEPEDWEFVEKATK